MNEAAEDRVKTPQILSALYAPIQVGLHQVEEVFRDVLRSKSPSSTIWSSTAFASAASGCGRPWCC